MTEEKTRIHTRISPETKRKMETAMPNANCQSQNEFVERAICFYWFIRIGNKLSKEKREW